MAPYFDRFDLCEAYACLCHDWGLYALATRLDRVGFKGRPDLSTETLEENALAIYTLWDERFTNNPPNAYDLKPMETRPI